MKIIYNRLIPFKGFAAINLFGYVFTKHNYILTERTLNHEAIHTAQMRELWYVPFYIIYFFEWVGRLFVSKDAYRHISFEREAYDHDCDMNYLKTRKKFAMWKSK